jgi:hypothetical protein
MPIRNTVIVIICFFLFYGCAAPPIIPVDENLNETNSSTVSIYRVSQFVNGGVGYRVFVNNDYIGELWGGGQINRRIKFGEVLIEFKPYEFGGIPSLGKKELTLVVESGYEYQLNMGSRLNSIVPIGSVMAVDMSTNIEVVKKKL